METADLFSDLLLAVATGSIDIVQHLIEVDKVSVHTRDSRGHSALDVAAAYGRDKIIDYLVQHRADPHASIQKSGMSALHIAASNGHKNVVRILLKFGCDKNLRDSSGATPMDYANMPPQIPTCLSAETVASQSADERVNGMRKDCVDILMKVN